MALTPGAAGERGFPLPPPRDSVEGWLFEYVTCQDADLKLNPGSEPSDWEEAPPERRLASPGRPSQWSLSPRAPRSPKRGALKEGNSRNQLFHTFLHHELQAAELMAWAVLAFPAAPAAFRRGLVAIFWDEIRHMQAYRDYLRERGLEVGTVPVRDWFWSRVPQVPDAAGYVALMGIGLEGGNLDHAARYASWFREVGDPEGAEVLEMVCDEEVRHVRFAVHWFREFTGGLDFQTWRDCLPEPLTPKLMRGRSLNTTDRLRAGLDSDFLEELRKW